MRRQASPQHSTSPARAAALAECVCEPAYFTGNVGVCYPRPSRPTASGGCAASWTARYVALEGGGRFVQCTSPRLGRAARAVDTAAGAVRAM